MAPYSPERHHRRSIRLRGYDYTQLGAYFVTICTHNRQCLFGEVVDGEMVLNKWGEIVLTEWFRSAEIRAEIELRANEFMVMPNHIHGIVWIVSNDDVGMRGHVGAHGRAPLHRPPRSLGAFIAGFKSAVTKRINKNRGMPGVPVWQCNYWEHVVRNERALNAIRHYIIENPLHWHLDRNNPNATGFDPMARVFALLLQDNTRFNSWNAVPPYPNANDPENQP